MKSLTVHSFKPYSKTPGISFPFPAYGLTIRLFPCRLEIYEKEGEVPSIAGNFFYLRKVKDFSVFFDIDRGSIEWRILFTEGVVHWKILPDKEGIVCLLSRSSRDEKVTIIREEKKKVIKKTLGVRESLTFDFLPVFERSESAEKLHLGCHKQAEAEKVMDRRDPREILPFWLALGKNISVPFPEPKGTFSLLKKCEESLEKKRCDELIPLLKETFTRGFSSFFIPSLRDTRYYGFELPEPVGEESAKWALLAKGASLIRSFFFRGEGNDLYFLPALPPELHCGRYLSLVHRGIHIDMEWSKKKIGKVILTARESAEVRLHFKKEIRRFRLRKSLRDKGTFFHNPTTVFCDPSAVLYLDRFEK